MTRWAIQQSDTLDSVGANRWVITANGRPISYMEEAPSDLANLCDILNDSSIEVPATFGIAEHAGIANRYEPLAIYRDGFVKVDDRGRWLCAYRFDGAPQMPLGLSAATARRLCPELAAALDYLYSDDSRPQRGPSPLIPVGMNFSMA